MPHSFGYRARTRDIFSKDFKKSGQIALTRYLTTYKLGDYVDIKGDGAIHKGMPHKYYHGRTGIVWNVTKSAIGVIVNKQVRNRIIKKKIHVRIEHVKPSNCRKQFLDRLVTNQVEAKMAKNAGSTFFLSRSTHSTLITYHVAVISFASYLLWNLVLVWRCPCSLNFLVCIRILYLFVRAATVVLKRVPVQPRAAFHVSSGGKAPLTLRPTAFSGYKVL